MVGFIAAGVVLAGLVLTPGALVLWAGGMRGVMLALAPAVSLGVIAVAAVLSSVVPTGWGILPIALVALVACAVIYLVRKMLTGRGMLDDAADQPRTPNRAWAMLFGGIVVSLLLWSIRSVRFCPPSARFRSDTTMSFTSRYALHLRIRRSLAVVSCGFGQRRAEQGLLPHLVAFTSCRGDSRHG